MKNQTAFTAFFSFSLILGVSIGAFAQESETEKPVSFKVYSNYVWDKLESTYSDPVSGQTFITQSKTTYDLGYFSPAVAFTNNRGNIHELELSRLQFNVSDFEVFNLDTANRSLQLADGQAEAKFNLAVRYEYILALNIFDNESKFQASVGFSGSPSLAFLTLNPKQTDQFPVSQTAIGLRLAVAPRINYSLNEKWFLDLNVPVIVGDISTRIDKNENPGLPLENRKSTTHDFSNFPPLFQVRLGVGLRI